MKRKTIYYSDPLNDDFANNTIETKSLGTDFKYVHTGLIWRFFEFIVYNIIVRPLVFTWIKLKYHQRFVNKKILRPYRKRGYFVYANHTGYDLDAFTPSMLTFPKKDYLICNPDATSIPGIKNLVMMLGALPTFTGLSESRAFNKAVEHRIMQGKAVIIYPEAHIWPYYTGIRPFRDISMAYPYRHNAACFAMVNVYLKRRLALTKRPKVVSHVIGPFFPDKSLSLREARKKLRDEIYNAMKRTSDSYDQYEYIRYIHVDDIDNTDSMSG